MPFSVAPLPSPTSSATLRVLVADDDVDTRLCLSDMLLSLGHDVVACVESGDEAVDRAASLVPDVALLDFHMPGLSGMDAAEALRLRAPSVAAVLLTGDAEIGLGGHDPASSNVFAMLPKPARIGSLDATLRFATGRHRVRLDAQRLAEEAHRRLEERRLVDQAKSLLMLRTGVTEREAWRILQCTSQDRATPMARVAAEIIAGARG